MTGGCCTHGRHQKWQNILISSLTLSHNLRSWPSSYYIDLKRQDCLTSIRKMSWKTLWRWRNFKLCLESKKPVPVSIIDNQASFECSVWLSNTRFKQQSRNYHEKLQFICTDKIKNPQGEIRGDNPLLQSLAQSSMYQYVKRKRQDFNVGSYIYLFCS